jgi:hypothetical protein
MATQAKQQKTGARVAAPEAPVEPAREPAEPRRSPFDAVPPVQPLVPTGQVNQPLNALLQGEALLQFFKNFREVRDMILSDGDYLWMVVFRLADKTQKEGFDYKDWAEQRAQELQGKGVKFVRLEKKMKKSAAKLLDLAFGLRHEPLWEKCRDGYDQAGNYWSEIWINTVARNGQDTPSVGVCSADEPGKSGKPRHFIAKIALTRALIGGTFDLLGGETPAEDIVGQDDDDAREAEASARDQKARDAQAKRAGGADDGAPAASPRTRPDAAAPAGPATGPKPAGAEKPKKEAQKAKPAASAEAAKPPPGPAQTPPPKAGPAAQTQGPAAATDPSILEELRKLGDATGADAPEGPVTPDEMRRKAFGYAASVGVTSEQAKGIMKNRYKKSSARELTVDELQDFCDALAGVKIGSDSLVGSGPADWDIALKQR